MNNYGIRKSDGTIIPLGEFESFEEVYKLHLFKKTPLLKNRVVVLSGLIPPQLKQEKSYNRWRIIWLNSDDTAVDWVAYYTKTAALEQLKSISTCNGKVKLILVPKYAYHESDDSTCKLNKNRG